MQPNVPSSVWRTLYLFYGKSRKINMVSPELVGKKTEQARSMQIISDLMSLDRDA